MPSPLLRRLTTVVTAAVCLAALWLVIAYQPPLTAYQSPAGAATASHLTDPFAAGWMLADTNGDGIIDFVAGKVVVPAHPTATENAAAADVAARIGFATTGLTPPIVISAAVDRSDGPRIYVAGSAAPASFRPRLEEIWTRLQPDEGREYSRWMAI